MPLTAKGEKILASLQKEYGAEKGKQVLYAGKNKGTFTGIDAVDAVIARLDAFVRGRSDASGVRIVHNKLLGGWYVVTGPHQTPLNGRFNSKEEAQEWLDRRKDSDLEEKHLDLHELEHKKLEERGDTLLSRLDSFLKDQKLNRIEGALRRLHRHITLRTDASQEMQAFQARQQKRIANAREGELRMTKLLERVLAAKKLIKQRGSTLYPGRASQAEHTVKMARANFSLAINNISNQIDYDRWMEKAVGGEKEAEEHTKAIEEQAQR